MKLRVLLGLAVIDLLIAMRPGGPTKAEPYDPRPRLFPAALAGYDHPARHIAWPWARGSGKTSTGQEMHAAIGTAVPRCATIYMSSTALRAVESTWDDWIEIAQRAKGRPYKSPAYHVRWLTSGARTLVTGADRIGMFDRKRGVKKIAFVHLDECQDWESSVLEYAVTKVFAPRLGDLEKQYGIKGRLLLSGTGGSDVKANFWRRVAAGETDIAVVAGITQWDNPHIADPEGEFIQACGLAGTKWRQLTEPIRSKHGGRDRWVDTDDQLSRREWFAEFNGGGPLQIFTLGGTSKCRRDELPTRDVYMVIGADFGTVDKAAAVCWLYSPHDPVPKLARWDEEAGLSNNGQVRFVRRFTEECIREYKPVEEPYVEGDGGSLGKGLIMDLQEAEGGWEIEAAEKQDKVPNVRTLAGDLRAGTCQIVDDLEGLLDRLKVPRWHPDHVGDKIAGHMPDAVDAALYGYRKVKEFHTYEPPPAPMTELDAELALERRVRAGIKRLYSDA